jgi:excinuclease ABC subunit A
MNSAHLSKNTSDIVLKGVRQNNLKNIDVAFPLGKMTVVTGLSGSGKSSLVFETLHAEGQRRYVETFSAYTRQFLDLLDKPDVDSVENIRPSIAIQQSNTVKTSRSTVGTMTELCDYFKVWFNAVASCYDPETGELVTDEHPERVWNLITETHAGEEVMLCFSIEKPESLKWQDIVQPLMAQGYSRVLTKNGIERLESLRLDELADSALCVIQDRVRIVPENRTRFIESAETAQHFGKGALDVWDREISRKQRFTRGLHSVSSGREFRDKQPAIFSFNSPLGACPRCRGFGRIIEIDYDLVIPDKGLSLKGGAIRAFCRRCLQREFE